MKEVAVGTVIQDKLQRNPESQPRWIDSNARLFAQYRELRTQGSSERQAAKELKVPRTTLQAWRMWHDTLDICPHVAEFFQRGPGLAFLHRLVIAFHMVCVEVGACGIRSVCLFLHLTGLNRFVAASYGAQQQVNVQVEQAMVTYHHDETARLANGMPPKRPHGDPGRNVYRWPLSHHDGPREQLHSFGTAGSGPRSNDWEYPHGTGPGTAQLPGDPIHQ